MKTLASVWPWSSSSSTRSRPRGAESNTWYLSLGTQVAGGVCLSPGCSDSQETFYHSPGQWDWPHCGRSSPPSGSPLPERLSPSPLVPPLRGVDSGQGSTPLTRERLGTPRAAGTELHPHILRRTAPSRHEGRGLNKLAQRPRASPPGPGDSPPLPPAAHPGICRQMTSRSLKRNR